MGNIHSLSSQVILGGVLVAAAVTYYTYPQKEQSNKPQTGTNKGKKKRKAEPDAPLSSSTGKADPNPIVVSFPAIVPGHFDSGSIAPDEPTATAPKYKKSKKKKGKSKATTPPSLASESTPTASSPSEQPNNKRPSLAPSTSHSVLKSPPSIDTGTDGSWTRIRPQSRRSNQSAWSQDQPSLSSDAAGTTGTGDSSPVAERADEATDIRVTRSLNGDHRTLAEKLLPKPKKTEVDEYGTLFPNCFTVSVITNDIFYLV